MWGNNYELAYPIYKLNKEQLNKVLEEALENTKLSKDIKNEFYKVIYRDYKEVYKAIDSNIKRGAFSLNFIRLIEEIKEKKPNDIVYDCYYNIDMRINYMAINHHSVNSYYQIFYGMSIKVPTVTFLKKKINGKHIRKRGKTFTLQE